MEKDQGSRQSEHKEVEPKDAKEKNAQEEKKAQQSSGQPKKKSKDDFTFMKILGEGSYSTVYLAEEIKTSKQYAIKVLEKRHIIKEKKVAYVSREKEALAMTNHPFIVRLYFTFQDKENLCIFLLFNMTFLFCCMVVDFDGPTLLDLCFIILIFTRHKTLLSPQ